MQAQCPSSSRWSALGAAVLPLTVDIMALPVGHGNGFSALKISMQRIYCATVFFHCSKYFIVAVVFVAVPPQRTVHDLTKLFTQ